MNKDKEHFVQQHSPDGGFLQSEAWRKFQEAVGRKTHHFEGDDMWANVIEHTLPVVGKYWYVPRGPVINQQLTKNSPQEVLQLIQMARETGAGWVRVEPANGEALQKLRETTGLTLRKAPHDMQPKEILVMDISLDEAEVLARMKPKTRYNIRLAEKKGVQVFTTRESIYQEKFLDLIEVTAKRDGIVPHPRAYYRKMFETLPESMLTLFVAEHDGEVLAANTMLSFGRYATYLHGASSNEKRSLMAPYLLQWRQILEAKARGCDRYDFGGVKMQDVAGSSWEGITRFKTGFAPAVEPTVFPGAYDVILSLWKYRLYLALQSLKSLRSDFIKILKRF